MNDKTFRDREILADAQGRGKGATLGAYLRLSGPGWLQSAITLGGGSLLGALYLGMLGGTSMLWLQLVAITIGVIMLSAIGYVTLSTNKRPYAAINEYINPVLGVSWITATVLANMIWIIPQFALCYDALDKNLTIQPLSEQQQVETKDQLTVLESKDASKLTDEEKTKIDQLSLTLAKQTSGLGDSKNTKMLVSGLLALVAFSIVMMSFNPGWMAKIFDLILKLIVAGIVLCFVAVVYFLATTTDSLDWGQILLGFIPNFNHWNSPAPEIQKLLSGLDGSLQTFWTEKILAKQQNSMITVTATAVGLNMTFLLPYSMLARGWDKQFRGLARFDLITAMAIPYLLVTTCIVIASAHAFHGKADPAYLSSDPAVMEKSVLFNSTLSQLEARYVIDDGESGADQRKNELNEAVNEAQTKLAQPNLTEDQTESLQDELADAQSAKKQKLAVFGASLTESEKRIIPTLVQPNASQLAATLEPMLGEKNRKYAGLIFGLGAFGMGFSTIIILSLINGYAFAEIFNRYESTFYRGLGAFAAILAGFCWFWIWQGQSRTWLGIVASSFAAILLPIAYIAFFALMNNVRLLGNEKPKGRSMIIWNVLMAIGVLGALAQSYGAISGKIANDPQQAPYLLGGIIVFLLLALVGFSARPRGDVEGSK